MKGLKLCLMSVLFSSCLSQTTAQQQVDTAPALNSKQQSVVTISAFTAKGDLVQLQKALDDGLDAGLTVNEIKEVLIQLYAYTGFPRSLNALNTFMEVLKARENKGIHDVLGKQPSPLPSGKNRLQFGTEMQTKLVGRPVKGEVYQFAPAIDVFLKEHLFGDIFGRNNLEWKTRELATISALAALRTVESQLRAHIGVSMYNGVTATQLNSWVSIVQTRVGEQEGMLADKALQAVLKQAQNNMKKNEATDDKAAESASQKSGMLVRIAEIEIHPDSLKQYKAILKEEAEASVQIESGVISIFPMFENDSPTQIRIVEVYLNRQAYEQHLKTPHFQRYKATTANMVKSLRLRDMEAIDPSTMTSIFGKLKK